jgi:copper(I)-binding protein
MLRHSLAFAASLFYCAAAMAQTGNVEIKDAWARATPGGAENGAAYLTLLSPTGDRLTGVSSPVAEKTQLHQMINDGGIMRMQEVTAIDLAPGAPVTLKPGGLHIMMIGLHQNLQPGQSIPLTLRFENSGTREVAAAVGKVGARGPDTHSEAAPKQPAH